MKYYSKPHKCRLRNLKNATTESTPMFQADPPTRSPLQRLVLNHLGMLLLGDGAIGTETLIMYLFLVEKNKNNLIGDEECINFRPSPNFKHMKKYLKSKFEEANSSPNQSSDPSTTPNSEEQETVKPLQATSNNMAERVQPPLPPNSPPPEFLIVPKQEVEDREYNDRSAVQAAPKTETAEVKKAPTETMCRQFARGTCTRGPTCIYVHKIILDQLPGVYTFCKNFQNTVCSLPKCKFVHATVFEKEHYYRTGLLPPHTLAHLESNSALGPPKSLEGTPNFTNPPPAMHSGVTAMPVHVCAPPDARPPLVGATHNERVLKRAWNKSDLALIAQDQDANMLIPRKCKTCDVTELSLQGAKSLLEKQKEDSKMIATKNKLLLEKDTRLNNVFDIMLLNSKTPLTSNLDLFKPGESLRSETELLQTRRLATPRRSTEANMPRELLALELESKLRNMNSSQTRMLGRILNIIESTKENNTHG